MLDVAGQRPDETVLRRTAPVVEQIARDHGITCTIDSSASLVDLGMTSMAMVDLMLAIEAEFDMTIPQSEMTPTNFQSIASLSAMLSRL